MGPGLLPGKPGEDTKVPLRDPWPENLQEFYGACLSRLRIRKAPLREWLWSCLEHIRKSFDQYKEEAIAILVKQHAEERALFQTKLANKDAIIESITDYFERLVGELTELSRTDPMTGLYNLPHLTRVAEIGLAASDLGRWAALAVVDVRDFKWYNDTPGFGHHVGDAIIKTVARVMVEKTRHVAGRAEDLCVRRSGDEFIFLLWNLKSAAEGYELAERFKEAVYHVDLTPEVGSEIAEKIRAEHPVKVDVGAVFLRLGNRSEDVFLRRQNAHKIVTKWLIHADKVMYWAKQDKSPHVYRMRTYISNSGELVEINQEVREVGVE
ncbi:MAG: GGDEF domain-containing protein [Candidatus Doudnabacteria bacterium]|nr:GGDEF domain-containing protein [Candidatus Doudnabacteria bacterium]